MSAAEVGNLVLTIVLGLLSIGFGIFSIWLSLHFNNKSGVALDAIRDLTNEIRALSHANFSQQKDFSSKMLDSILARDQFGMYDPPEGGVRSSVLENVVRRQLSETEVRISAGVEDTVRSLVSGDGSRKDPLAVKEALASIRSDIKLLTDQASSVSSNLELPLALRDQLTALKEFPAYFVLIAAIVKENLQSVESMRMHVTEYNFPEGWEGAVANLITRQVLSGSVTEFKIVEEYRTPLAAFVDKNWVPIRRLVELYASPQNRNGQTAEEIQIANRIVV